jgi:hypothetical protein
MHSLPVIRANDLFRFDKLDVSAGLDELGEAEECGFGVGTGPGEGEALVHEVETVMEMRGPRVEDVLHLESHVGWWMGGEAFGTDVCADIGVFCR